MNSLKVYLTNGISAAKGKKKAERAAIGLGVTSLMTVMAVVMLTSFALLSLLSANSDLFLSEKAARAIEDYYEADGRAEAWMQGLDALLEAETGTTDAWKLTEAGYPAEATEGGYLVKKVFAIGDKKNLEVVAKVTAEGSARVISWQSSSVYEPKL